jgi:hypothetical protein
MFPFIHLRLTRSPSIISHSISSGAGILGAIDRLPSKNRIVLPKLGRRGKGQKV